MFDISFIELVVIFVVALIVLGPEKLPGAVRTGALWIGRAKRSFNKARAEIEQQLNADDIRRQLHNESILADIEKARKNADKLVKDTKQELNKVQDDVTRAVSLTPPPVSTEAAPVVTTPVITNSAVEGLPTGQETWPDKQDKQTETAAQAGTADDAEESQPTELHTELQTEEPPAQAPAVKTPVQDFYNNPPSGVVTVTGKKLIAAENPSPADDATRQKE